MEEEKKKVNTGIGYKNGKYRPSVFFDKSMQAEIEKHFREEGYRTFNEYINALVSDDMNEKQMCVQYRQNYDGIIFDILYVFTTFGMFLGVNLG